MTAHPEAWRGEGSPTVAEMIRTYLTASLATDGEEARRKAHDKLTRAGLAIVKEQRTGRLYLAIPPRHSGIASIFKGTDFEKKGGDGAWNIPLRGAPKVEGRQGVLRVNNVPRLERQKCALFWLDGDAEVGGERVKIFERSTSEDEIDQIADDRVVSYRQALALAPTQDAMTAVRDRARQLLDDLAQEDPELMQKLEDAFNVRWFDLEPPAP
jgi:hypothetical protein